MRRQNGRGGSRHARRGDTRAAMRSFGKAALRNEKYRLGKQRVRYGGRVGRRTVFDRRKMLRRLSRRKENGYVYGFIKSETHLYSRIAAKKSPRIDYADNFRAILLKSLKTLEKRLTLTPV